MALRYFAEMPKPGRPWRFVSETGGQLAVCPPDTQPESRDSVTVFVPGTEVSAHRVRLAARRMPELSRLAAFAIEDDLAVPVETVHVAVAPVADADGGRLAFAADIARMEGWLAQLETAGLAKASLVPDTSLLASGEALHLSDRLLVWPDTHPLAIDKSWPDEVMGALLKDLPPIGETVQESDDLLALARRATGREHLTDLRQGIFAPASESAVPLSRLRLPLTLAAAAGLAWIAQTGLAARSMDQLADVMNGEAKRQYAAALPGEAIPANPASALRARAGTRGAAVPSFRDMSAVLYEAIAASPGAGLSSLRYDADVGELRATLNYPAFGADLDLKTAIEQAGLRVQLGDTRMEDGRVVGDLTMEAGA